VDGILHVVSIIIVSFSMHYVLLVTSGLYLFHVILKKHYTLAIV